MSCAFHDSNLLPIPIPLISAIQSRNISIPLLFEGGEVEWDVVRGGEAVFFAVAQRFAEGREVPGYFFGDAPCGLLVLFSEGCEGLEKI